MFFGADDDLSKMKNIKNKHFSFFSARQSWIILFLCDYLQTRYRSVKNDGRKFKDKVFIWKTKTQDNKKKASTKSSMQAVRKWRNNTTQTENRNKKAGATVTKQLSPSYFPKFFDATPKTICECISLCSYHNGHNVVERWRGGLLKYWTIRKLWKFNLFSPQPNVSWFTVQCFTDARNQIPTQTLEHLPESSPENARRAHFQLTAQLDHTS